MGSQAPSLNDRNDFFANFCKQLCFIAMSSFLLAKISDLVFLQVLERSVSEKSILMFVPTESRKEVMSSTVTTSPVTTTAVRSILLQVFYLFMAKVSFNKAIIRFIGNFKSLSYNIR